MEGSLTAKNTASVSLLKNRIIPIFKTTVANSMRRIVPAQIASDFKILASKSDV
jgi:hypothetical protein